MRMDPFSLHAHGEADFTPLGTVQRLTEEMSIRGCGGVRSVGRLAWCLTYHIQAHGVVAFGLCGKRGQKECH